MKITESRVEITEHWAEVGDQVKDAFHRAPKASRKDFALWVTENHEEIKHYLFALLDGKDVRTLIYKQILKEIDDE